MHGSDAAMATMRGLDGAVNGEGPVNGEAVNGDAEEEEEAHDGKKRRRPRKRSVCTHTTNTQRAKLVNGRCKTLVLALKLLVPAQYTPDTTHLTRCIHQPLVSLALLLTAHTAIITNTTHHNKTYHNKT